MSEAAVDEHGHPYIREHDVHPPLLVRADCSIDAEGQFPPVQHARERILWPGIADRLDCHPSNCH
jgi:hypothetical protein